MFDRQIETLSVERLRALQERRLRRLVKRLYERVPFYRSALEAAGLSPEDISSIEDLPRLPFTRKEHFRQLYPFGLLAAPRERVARVHASSGTTGKPTAVAYTKRDLEIFAEVNARSLAAAGAKAGMMLHNAYGYGLFTGGLGLHAGAEKLGMAVVPVSGGMTERQIMLIEDFRPEVISCTPSYAQTLAERFQARGRRPEEISLQIAVLGAEPWTEAIRAHVDSGLGVSSVNIYGLTEIIGPGVSQECIETRSGSHLWEDHFLPEVVDPDSGEPVPEGRQGVLVLTTLTKEAMPLLRYWTGDLTSLDSRPCPCGRTHRRMAPITGRTDDMLIVRGVNFYPTQIEEALQDLPGLAPHYQLEVRRVGSRDEVELKVECSPALSSSDVGRAPPQPQDPLQRLAEEVRRRVKAKIGLNVAVDVAAPGTVPRSEGGKIRRVVDRR